MKKFQIRIAKQVREVNANEYNVTPKTNGFTAKLDGEQTGAWSTSGKGKSAIPNYYLYFKADGVLYYFRSTAAEIDSARKDGFEVSAKGFEVEAAPEGEQTPAAEPETPQEQKPTVVSVEPKVRRRQRATA